MTAAAIPACLACGTCCFSSLESFVRVTGFDYARLDSDANELTQFIGNRSYMKMYDGHCAALVLVTASATFVCSVYEKRPETCRDLERGSSACDAELHAKSERPPALLQLLQLLQLRRSRD